MTNKIVYIFYDVDKNFDPIYIGIGNHDRPAHHFCDSQIKINNPWHCKLRSLLAQGYTKEDILENVVIDSENLTWEQACDREIELIRLFGRRDLKTGTLFNLTDGGDGQSSRIVSEENRLKFIQRLIGNQYRTGKTFTHSSETREKMIASWTEERKIQHARNKNSKGHISPSRIAIVAICGGHRKEFSNIREVAKEGYSYSAVQKALRTGQMMYNRKWEYV